MTERLREFLYVDIDRVRSLLAQLQGGIVEAIKAQGVNVVEGRAGAEVFGVGARGGYAHEWRTEESRSLQELMFVAFEESADDAGLIRDLDESFTDPVNWGDGSVHRRIEAGMIVRLTSLVQILDGGLFRSRIDRLSKMVDAVLDLAGDAEERVQNVPASGSARKRPTAAQASRRDLERRLAKQALMDGLPPEQLEAIPDFVEAFVGDSIAMRVLPCGSSNLEFGFNGALLGRDEYIQREREHLFSRYGARASDWTAVLQIAAVPDQVNADDQVEEDTDEADDASNVDDGDSSFSRAGMELLAGNLLDMMEQVGIVDGPRWPSITVTPLALYRLVPSGA